MPGETLHERLRAVRHRMIALGGAVGLSGGLAAGALLLLICVWLDLMWELSPALRIAAWAVAGIAGLALLTVIVLVACRAAHDRALARRMDRAAGTGGEILSGLDLDRASPQSLPLSEGLAAMAVERAGRLAAGVARAQVVSSRPARRSAGALVSLMVAAGIVALIAPDLAYTQWLRFSDPFGDNPPFSRVRLSVRPGNAKVVYGSDLDIHVAASGPPVERVELVLNSGQATPEVLPMFPEGAGKWRAALTGVVQPAQYFVRAESARSRMYSIGVITVPRIEKVEFRMAPPAYTRSPPYEGPLPKDGLTGLKGTQVHVVATSNRPLRGGSLRLSIGRKSAPIALVGSGSLSQTASGDFEIIGSGKFELHVIDVDGQRSQEPFSGPITLVEDQRPFVRIVEPPAASLATPTVTIPVAVSAEDDYGISRVQLFRSLNDSRPMPMDIPVPPDTGARLEATEALPLSAYGLSPGDVIKLFARVEDNDPAGAKGAESALVTIQIISQDDFERMMRVGRGMEMLVSKYRQAQRRLESLKKQEEGLRKKLKQSPPDSAPAKEAQEALEQFSKRLQQEAGAMRAAAKAALPYDVDKELTQHLSRLAESLEAAARAVERLQQQAAAGELTNEQLQEALQQMMQDLAGEERQFDEQALEPLAFLERVLPLKAAESKFVALYVRQRELSDRLASLKGQDGQDDPALKARMRDLEEEQRHIRGELGELLDEIEAAAGRLPDVPELAELRATALKFAKDVRSSGATEAMNAAEAALAELSGTNAHAEATRAADILEKFISQCQGMGDQAGQCPPKFGPSMCQALGNSMAQMLGEMGLGGKSGPMGAGLGAGGGYSARASTMDNMGLYGNQPTLGGGDGTGSRQSDQAGVATSAPGSLRESADASAAQATRPLEAAGAGAAAVPARYRQNVIDYFQRIAEETAGD